MKSEPARLNEVMFFSSFCVRVPQKYTTLCFEMDHALLVHGGQNEAPGRAKGIQAALASAIFLGLAPIFGKQAILVGFSPLAVVALRTGIAVFLLLCLMAIFQRPFFYIYPVGLVGCLLAGFINGLGSILYYTGLSRVDASVGQLIYSFYPLFFVLWLLVDRQPIHRVTIYRLLLAIPGVILLVSTGSRPVDLIGALMMVGSAILYALHLLINQRILYEVPAPTVTLYTLLSMSATVLVAFLVFDRNFPAGWNQFCAGAWPGWHHFSLPDHFIPGCETPGWDANSA